MDAGDLQLDTATPAVCCVQGCDVGTGASTAGLCLGYEDETMPLSPPKTDYL